MLANHELRTGEMIRNGVFGAVLLGVSIVASAAQWKIVGATHSSTISIDTSSVLRTGSVVKVWQKVEWAIPTPQPGYQTPVSTLLILNRIDCHEHTISAGNSTFYDAAGGVIGSVEGAPADFRDIPPGSVGDTMRATVCTTK
jgi:hypothetical protein